MMTAAEVKAAAKECGADIVGIAPMDRFEGAPKQFDPRYIFPDAKVMIVLGFRIHRGTLRGVEEGTFFSNYSSMGYAAINHIRQPMMLWNFCNVLEDSGWEAVPIHNAFPWSNAVTTVVKDKSTIGNMRPEWSRPVSPDKPAPDVFFSLRFAAVAAGMGEIGWSKMFLCPEFGPRVRLAAVMTDMPLEADPMYQGPKLCDRCMNCATECTVGAIDRKKSISITIGGQKVEWSDMDHEKCSLGFCGGAKEFNPWMLTEEDQAGFNKLSYGNAQRYKVPPQNEYGRAIEGARGCIRACMIHLEKRGKLTNKFHNEFRKRPAWKLS